MEQVLFILRNSKISQWNLSRGKLLPVTDCGRQAVPYSSETANGYWTNWKENNQVADGDVYDAIFLSESLDDFGELPSWICANSTNKSAWTIEQLSLLASEKEFVHGLCLIQGKKMRLIGDGKVAEAIKLCLKASLVFTLPNGTAKPKPLESKKSKKSATVEKASNKEGQIESSAEGGEPVKKAVQCLKDLAMTYEDALSTFSINLDSCFPSSKFIDVPVDANLEKAVLHCPEGSTLKLAAGTYTIPGNRMLCIDKNIRVVGVSPKRSIISGHFYCKNSITLVVENLSGKEVYGSCVWGSENGFLIVRNSRFDGGGIHLGDGCTGVVSDVFVDKAEEDVIVGAGARAIVLGSQLTNMTEHYIIGFENTRVYCENVRMDCGNSCDIREGINARFKGSRWFLRHCFVGNIKAMDKWHGNGISVGSHAKVYLDDVSFDSLISAVVKNDGFCEYHDIRINQCAKGLEGEGNYTLRNNPIQLSKDFFN